jgi:hypothetical protein
MRVLPLALAVALFFGVTAILIYLSGLSSCNAAQPVDSCDEVPA